jgi:hypothetical protein
MSLTSRNQTTKCCNQESTQNPTGNRKHGEASYLNAIEIAPHGGIWGGRVVKKAFEPLIQTNHGQQAVQAGTKQPKRALTACDGGE